MSKEMSTQAAALSNNLARLKRDLAQQQTGNVPVRSRHPLSDKEENMDIVNIELSNSLEAGMRTADEQMRLVAVSSQLGMYHPGQI